MDTQRLQSEADLVTVSTEPDQDCPQVQVDILIYEVFLEEGSEEVRDTIEMRNIRDVFNTTKTIRNINEPWIAGTVMLRYVVYCVIHIVNISLYNIVSNILIF